MLDPTSLKVVMGIDPGMDGGVAWISQITRQAIPMPTVTAPKSKRRELDSIFLASYLEEMKCTRGIRLCIIEDVHSMPKQGVASTFNFALGFGIIRGILLAHKIALMRITPQAWKKEILAGTKKDKLAAITYCQQRYPDVNLVPEGCRVPHDGMADALCMAEYGLRRLQAEGIDALNIQEVSR